jgi:DNA-binding FadR family transcriptional regulator
MSFRLLQIHEQVAEKIRIEISTGRYRPDARLPSERDLAEQFGVGRPAVREALFALQNEGLVITRRNSGTYIATSAPKILSRAATDDGADGQDRQEIHDAQPDYSPSATLDVRLIIEPAIARRAAAKRKRDTLAEHYLAQMDALVDVAGPDECALWEIGDRLFHRQLAVMTGDALLTKCAQEIAEAMNQPHLHGPKGNLLYDPARIRLYAADHRLIYEAILNGEADAAAFYVEQHLHRVRRDTTSV